MVSGTTDINIDAGFSRATDPGMALYHNLGLDDTMTPGGSTGHPNQPGPGYGTALGHNQGCGPDPGASEWPLAVTWAMDINPEPGHGRSMDPDMVLSSRLGQAVIMVLRGCAGHQDWHSPSL